MGAKIDGEKAKKHRLENELTYLPNSKILGVFNLKLRLYQKGIKRFINRENTNADTNIYRSWLIKNGEAPIIFDTNLVNLEENNLKNFLINKGFFDAQVTHRIKHPYRNKKMVFVKYDVTLGDKWVVNSLHTKGLDNHLDSILHKIFVRKNLQAKEALDLEKLKNVKNELYQEAKQNGYFYFDDGSLKFWIDTNCLNKHADLYIDYLASNQKKEFTRQIIKSVIFEFENGSLSSQHLSTVLNGVNYRRTNNHQLDPKVIDEQIEIRPMEIYNPIRTKNTYNNLLNLSIFESIKITFSPSKQDSTKYLDCRIKVKQKKSHEITWEPQLVFNAERQINQNRTYGAQNLLRLNNRDVLGHAEQLDINWTIGLESQYGGGAFQTNCLSNNINLDFILPHLIFGKKHWERKSFDKKQTIFIAGYIYENNVVFKRTSFPFGFTYEIQNNHWTYQLAPLQIAFNNADLQKGQNISQLNELVIRRLVNNNLIAGPRISLFYQKARRPNQYLKTNLHLLELSGNMIRLSKNLLARTINRDDEILGVRYFQFARSEMDIRASKNIQKNNSLACRLHIGAGVPYGNSNIMPFERQFFVGGANGLRAFRPRSIGPGNYVGKRGVQFEKSGDLIAQTSIEFRTKIGKSFLEPALFMDAGNCWSISEQAGLEKGTLKLSNIFQSLALNTGIGMRVNLEYFVFRVDWGIALHNPSMEENKRWVVNRSTNNKESFIRHNTLLNIGIGYPF